MKLTRQDTKVGRLWEDGILAERLNRIEHGDKLWMAGQLP
jgi:hypothetical protein